MTAWAGEFSSRPNVRIEANVYVESQNLLTNKSIVRVILTAFETAQQPTYSNYAPENSWSVTVGSGSWSDNWTYDYRPSGLQSYTLLNTTIEVTHDGGGDKSVTVTASASTVDLGSASIGSQTLYLPRIPTAPTVGAFNLSGATEATLNWSAPGNDNGVVTGYRMQYGTDPTFAVCTTIQLAKVTSKLLTGLTPGAVMYGRVAALTAFGATAYSASATVVIVASIGELDGWEGYGTLPGGLSSIVTGALRRGSVYPLGTGAPTGLLREIQRSGSGSVAAGAVGIRRTFTGLTVGATYKLSGTALSLQNTTPTGNIYRWAVVGVGSGADGTTSDTTHPVAIPDYTFVATATSHVVQIQLNEGPSWSGAGWFEAVAFYGIKLTEIPNPSPNRLQDVALVSSLAKHFTVACDTVGAVWWVDSDDVTQFRQVPESTALKAIFTDKRAPGEKEYIDLAASYDTRNVVNSLAVKNYGRDAGTGNSDDEDYALVDEQSVSMWGVRTGSVEMSMRTDVSTELIEARAGVLLNSLKTPQIAVAWIEWNAQDDPDLAASLDVQDRVRVKFGGKVADYRIVGISHKITGSRWLMTLTFGAPARALLARADIDKNYATRAALDAANPTRDDVDGRFEFAGSAL